MEMSMRKGTHLTSKDLEPSTMEEERRKINGLPLSLSLGWRKIHQGGIELLTLL